MTEIEQLEQAIAALEAQRAMLGDAVVDAALAPMREKLATLKAQAQASEQRRRQITVLFADVSGFTAMSETMDAEDVTEIMNDLWERLDRAITEHGGFIDKHIGDAVMALWGAETAHENDPEQAIRAALAMQTELAAFRDDRQVDLAMRIGINTGPVLLGQVGTTGEYTAIGDTVNTASRLEHAAPVGGILISHDTYRHVRGIFDVQLLEPFQVKGKVEPLQVYLVTWAKPRAFHLHTRGVEGVETRMIGRQTEFQRVQDAFLTAIQDRELQVITVVGEAGIGKSRLLYEFQAWSELRPELFWLFQGRATEGVTRLPYALLRDVFAFRFEIRDGDPPAAARERLERGIADFMHADPDAVEKAHFIGHLIGLDFSSSPHIRGILDDPEQIRDQALHHLVQFFTAATATNPAVLLLEDLHWADDSSLDAIAHLMRRGPDLPLLILALARPSFYERRPQWGEGLEAHARLDLRPLSKRASRQLVAEILQKMAGVPLALRDLVVSSAEGNPFYVEELIKMLIDAQVIVTSTEEWRVDATRLVEARVPPTLTGVLQARLDGLLPDDRTTLQQASVVGRVFWDDAVRALSAERGVSGIRAALQALRARELVFGREESAFAGTQEYIFKHALLREVTYETVLKRLRPLYHAQVAAWLVERSGERAGEYAALIAEHWEQAGEMEKASEWYGRAGKQAAEAFAPETAVGYYRKALELAQTCQLPETRQVSWYEGLGAALHARARYAEAVEAYTAMGAAAEAAGGVVAQARALYRLAWLQEALGDFHAALESSERAERLAASAGEVGREACAYALHYRGWTLFRLGDTAGALTLAKQALALSTELGEAGQHVQARSLNLLGVTLMMLGHFEQAERHQEQALALHRALGDRRSVGTMLNNLGETAYRRGDYATAATRYQEALIIAREVGHRDCEMLYLNNLCGTRVRRGDYAAAEADLRKVIGMAGTASWFALSETYRFLAEVCLGQSRTAEAWEAAQRALVLGQETGNQEYIGWAWRVLGNCGLLMADFRLDVPDRQLAITDPRSCYAESLRIFTEIGAEAERARTLRDWARYELARGDREKGAAMWQEARAIFEKLNMPLEVARAEAERK